MNKEPSSIDSSLHIRLGKGVVRKTVNYVYYDNDGFTQEEEVTLKDIEEAARILSGLSQRLEG